jgi:hypothetical protein
VWCYAAFLSVAVVATTGRLSTRSGGGRLANVAMALVFVFPLTSWPGDHKCLEIDVAPGRTAASEVCVEADATDVAHRAYDCFFVYLSILSYPRSRTPRRFFSFFFFFFFFVAASWGCGSCAVSESVFLRCVYSLYLVLYVTYAVARPFLDCASRSRIGRQLPLAPSPRDFGERSLECGAILGGG